MYQVSCNVFEKRTHILRTDAKHSGFEPFLKHRYKLHNDYELKWRQNQEQFVKMHLVQGQNQRIGIALS